MCSFLALYSKVLVLPVWVLGLPRSPLYPACDAERTSNKKTKPFLFHQTSGFLWAGLCSWCLAGSGFSTWRHDCERGTLRGFRFEAQGLLFVPLPGSKGPCFQTNINNQPRDSPPCLSFGDLDMGVHSPDLQRIKDTLYTTGE